MFSDVHLIVFISISSYLFISKHIHPRANKNDSMHNAILKFKDGKKNSYACICTIFLTSPSNEREIGVKLYMRMSKHQWA